MNNKRYRLDPNTLTFEKRESQLGRRIRKAIYYGISTIILASVISWGVISNYETPPMKNLKSENSELRTQFVQLDEKLQTIEQALTQIENRDDKIYRVMLNSEPIPSSVRTVGFGGSSNYSEFEVFRNAEDIIETARKVDILSKKAYIQLKSYEEVFGMAYNQKIELASTPAIIPISNNDLSFISSQWGMRMHPILNFRRFHYGIDFVARTGTPVYATADGVISSIKSLSYGHGRHIIIDHGFGYETLYGHLSKFNVSQGQKVKRGELIGFVGNTGTSTAPHLHYEVHRSGKPVNPANYFFKDLTPQEYEQIIALSSTIMQSLD